MRGFLLPKKINLTAGACRFQQLLTTAILHKFIIISVPFSAIAKNSNLTEKTLISSLPDGYSPPCAFTRATLPGMVSQGERREPKSGV